MFSLLSDVTATDKLQSTHGVSRRTGASFISIFIFPMRRLSASETFARGEDSKWQINGVLFSKGEDGLSEDALQVERCWQPFLWGRYPLPRTLLWLNTNVELHREKNLTAVNAAF